jgi:cytochrome c oxidase subunit 3
VHENNRKDMKWGLILAIVPRRDLHVFQAYEYSHAPSASRATSTAPTSSWRRAFTARMSSSGRSSSFVCLMRALRGPLHPEKHIGFEAAAWYWHFVDVVWLFLFAAIYIWGG